MRLDLLAQIEVLRVEQREMLYEQLELQSALRAERAHVEQLKRKTQLLEELVPIHDHSKCEMARLLDNCSD